MCLNVLSFYTLLMKPCTQKSKHEKHDFCTFYLDTGNLGLNTYYYKYRKLLNYHINKHNNENLRKWSEKAGRQTKEVHSNTP